MGWVQHLLTILHLFSRCGLLLVLLPPEALGEPQLWEWGDIDAGANVGLVGNLPLEWGRITDGGGGDNFRADSQFWEPDRKAKSLAFLGKGDEDGISESVGNSLDNDSANTEDSDIEVTTKVTKKAKLNVSDKDSPYALIDKYFPERESYFYQNQDKFLTEYREGQAQKTDIGNLDPSEVWLADSSLLVLKGGSTADRDGYDDPWEPLDDFQAPYREPVLPPPDFDPDSLDIGVGIPIEDIVEENQRTRKKLLKNQEKEQKSEYTFVKPFEISNNFDLITREELGGKTFQQAFSGVNTVNPLKSYEDEVAKSQEEFKNFFHDVSQFINDMENFHSSRNERQQEEISMPELDNHIISSVKEDESNENETISGKAIPNKHSYKERQIGQKVPRQRTTPKPVKLSPMPKLSRNQISKRIDPEPRHHKSSQYSLNPVPKHNQQNPFLKNTEDTTSKISNFITTNTYPLSYSSPFSKVYLSTAYKSKYTTLSTHKNELSVSTTTTKNPNQARSTEATTKPSIENIFGETLPLEHKKASTFTTTRPSSIQRFTSFPSGNSQDYREKELNVEPNAINAPATFRPSRLIFSTRLTTPTAKQITVQQNHYQARPPVPTIQPKNQFRNRTVTLAPHVVTEAYEYRDTGDWQPVTVPSATNYFSSPPRDRSPIGNFEATYNQAPTPYSLFQSVPENIDATDVFHLSQNVDFGKKLEKIAARIRPQHIFTNEVDTGGYNHLHPVVSPHKPQPITSSPRSISKAKSHRNSGVPFVSSLFGTSRRRKLVPGRRKGRVRNTVRRRRPKQVADQGSPSVDRQGTGDVRYVSFYSGGTGGREWGYSYNLGRK